MRIMPIFKSLAATMLIILLTIPAFDTPATAGQKMSMTEYAKRKKHVVAEVRKLREMCVREYKVRVGLIERANKSQIEPTTRRVGQLKKREWELRRAIPVNTATAKYKSAYYRWKSTAAQLKDAQAKERKLVAYWNAKYDQATIFYNWAGKLNTTARWLVNKASSQQVLSYNYRNARRQVQALFRKYPPSTRR